MTALPTSFAGKTAVVTGGTNGIGAATALMLRRQGARVVIIGRSTAKADAMLAHAATLALQVRWRPSSATSAACAT